MTADPGPDEMLDLRGLKCPLPVLRTRRALSRMMPGATLEVRCTDPLASLDIPNLLRETGDVMLVNTRQEGETRFRIRRAGPVPGGVGPESEDPSAAAGVDRTR